MFELFVFDIQVIMNYSIKLYASLCFLAGTDIGKKMNDCEKELYKVLYERRSIRSYIEGKPVEKEKIIKLLEAAMAAPSACNIQPWEFIVVSEEKTISAIKESIKKYGKWNAPLIVVVCGYTEFIPWEGDSWKLDCAAAIENMLLAAVVLGLGSVWIGGSDPQKIRRILDIPDNVHPMGLVYFGYPSEEKPPRTQYRHQAVHWEKYDRAREHRPVPGNIFGQK